MNKIAFQTVAFTVNFFMQKNEFNFKAIGIIKSDFIKKYEAPKQSNLENGNFAQIILEKHKNFEMALSDIESFSHIWIIYVFHLNRHWKAKVLPPRQDRIKRGVFSTRSPYRPNPIGMTVVRFIKKEKNILWIEDHDLLDGTPILDIKPYVPYADIRLEANNGWLIEEKALFTIQYQNDSDLYLKDLEKQGIHFIKEIERRLQFDPFPHPYRRITHKGDYYQMRFKTFCIDYCIEQNQITIFRAYPFDL